MSKEFLPAQKLLKYGLRFGSHFFHPFINLKEKGGGGVSLRYKSKVSDVLRETNSQNVPATLCFWASGPVLPEKDICCASVQEGVIKVRLFAALQQL